MAGRCGDIAAAQMLGADLAYMGTRFIATQEANAKPDYKQMILDSAAKDVTYTPAFSGIPANYLTKSIVAAGLDPATLQPKGFVDMDLSNREDKKIKAWRDIWSAGQGTGSIADVPTVAELVERLTREYRDAAGGDAGLRAAE
jgi:nitronate monooxygenase